MNKYKENILMFYSRSADGDMKYLSNFEPCEVKLFFFNFPSVEHGFQAMKYLVSGEIKYALEFQTGKLYGLKPPKDIKKEGGKTGFKRRKVQLNIPAWENEKDFIMKELINSRYTTDEKFKTIVDKIKSKNYLLFHFESTRGRGISYWGGSWKGDIKNSLRNQSNFNGENTLGKMIKQAQISKAHILMNELNKLERVH